MGSGNFFTSEIFVLVVIMSQRTLEKDTTISELRRKYQHGIYIGSEMYIATLFEYSHSTGDSLQVTVLDIKNGQVCHDL